MTENQPSDPASMHPGFPHAHDVLMDAPIGIFTSTPAGRYLSVNPALARMHGYSSPEEMIVAVTDITTQIYVDPADRESFIRLLEEHGEVVNHECRFRRRDGTVLWVSRNARAVKDSQGLIIAYQGFTTDITERKRAEGEKEEADKRFQLMFMNAPTPYQSLDEQGNFLEVNQSFIGVLGYSRDELIGRNFGDILHPDWKPHFKENFPKFKAVGEILGVEFEMVKKDGSTILVYFNGKIQRDDQGRFLRTHCIFQDVTKLRQTEEYLQQVLDATNDGIWDYDLVSGKFVFSERFAQMLGYASEEIHDFGCFCADNIHPDDAARFQKSFDDYVHGRAPAYALECRLKTKHGAYKWIYTRGRSLQRDCAGRALRVVGAHTDISGRKLIEEALRESEEKHRRLFETMTQGVVYYSADGTIISVNPAAERILGLRFDQMRDQTTADQRWRFVTEDGAEISKTDFPAMVALRTGKTVGPATLLLHHPETKTDTWLSITAIPLLHPGETTPVQAYAIFEDITERKQAEERYQTLFREMLDGFALHEIVCDAAGKPVDYRYLAVNPAFERFTGLKGEAVVGKTVLEVLPETEKIWIETFGQVALTGEPVVFENFSTALQKYFAVTAFSPTIGQFACIFADVTELKRSEEALRLQSLVLDQIKDLVVVTDLAGRITYVNQAEIRHLGRPREEILRQETAIFGDDPGHGATQREILERTLQDGAWEGEVVNYSKDGARKVLDCRTQVVFNDKGDPVALSGIASDITERKLTEQALLQAKQEAEESNQAKSEFLANMSHELRTPFNGIMGMLQLLQTTPLDPEQAQFTAIAMKSADRFTRLLTDILDISRIEAGKMEIHKEPFSPRDLHDSVADLFTITAQEKGVRLSCSIDPVIPPRLIGDEVRIRQILFNLVGNALKFTNKGSVKVEMVPLSCRKSDECRILFSVSDTGIGIPEEKLNGLFKPFVQLDGSYTRSYQGAGLGLSIVKRLVELMGGVINIESTLGKGTTLYFVLPLMLPQGEDIAVPSGRTPLAEAKRGFRILLAEDEPSNALPTVKLLEKAGHRVILAENGEQAVDLYATQEFDVILMDIQMPVLNGVEATKEIRRLEDKKHSSIPASQHPRIPIIALTAYAMAGDREKFLQAGMDDYVSKPVQFEDLVKILERFFGSKTGAKGNQNSSERTHRSVH